jgi:predicted regulator of Ras-like GTPase activity (Roadblock/LC7/MglB family)
LNEEGLQPDVNSLDVLISLADLYVENGLFDEAKDLLKTAIKENSEVVKPYLSLSKVYISQGEKREAAEILRRALKIEPENVEIKQLFDGLKIEKEEKKEEKVKEEEIKEKVKIEEKTKEEKPVKIKGGDSLGEVLKNLLKVKGIIGVLVVDDIGALIDANMELPMERESTGAIISSIYDRICYSASDLGLGTVGKVLFELPGGNIVVLGSKSLRFIILTNKNVLLGELENVLIDAFDRTIALLGVE